jgi:hypothetical protein
MKSFTLLASKDCPRNGACEYVLSISDGGDPILDHPPGSRISHSANSGFGSTMVRCSLPPRPIWFDIAGEHGFVSVGEVGKDVASDAGAEVADMHVTPPRNSG